MNKIFKTTVIIMIISMLSKVIGVIQESILGATFGVGYKTDIYVMCISIVTSIFSIISPTINSAFMPVLMENKDIEKRNKLINNFISILIIVCFFITFFTVLNSDKIIKLIFPSLNTISSFNIANKCLKIILSSLVIIALQSIFTVILQAHNKFVIPSLISIVYNVILSIYLITMSNRFGVMGLIICVIIANIVQWIIHIPSYNKMGYKYKFYVDIHDKDMFKIIKLSIPIIIGVSVSQVNIMVDKSLSSYIGVGSMTLMSYANKLNLITFSIIVTTIVTINYPILIKLKANNKIKQYEKTLIDIINIMCILLIPIIFGIILIKEDIISVLFGYGNFNSKDITETAKILKFLVPSILAYGIREILNKAFYSMHDMKTPMLNSILGIILNIFLSILLSKKFGLEGIALATTISIYVIVILMFISFYKYVNLNYIYIIQILIKCLTSSILMYFILKVLYSNMNNGHFLNILLISIFGVLIYFTILYILKIEYLDKFLKDFRVKLKL